MCPRTSKIFVTEELPEMNGALGSRVSRTLRPMLSDSAAGGVAVTIQKHVRPTNSSFWRWEMQRTDQQRN